MEVKPALDSEFGAGLKEWRIDRKADMRNHIEFE